MTKNMNEHGYLELMEKIWKKGEVRTDRTGVGTRSLFGEQLHFDMSDGNFPLLTTKRIPYKSQVLPELLWFLSGDTDVNTLQEMGCTIWDEWATAEECAKFGREEGDLGPVYGYLWRRFGEISESGEKGPIYRPGVDQIENLVKGLRASPDSRRHIVTGWDPVTCNGVTLPPCHTLWQCYVHMDHTLDLHLYMRSADYFLGVPFNIASYVTLLAMLAHHCEYYRGKLVISFGDVHLYMNHEEQVAEQLSRDPGFPPKLRIVADVDKPIWEYSTDDFVLDHYLPQATIKAEVAV